ncbi:uncharacterized protein LOC116340540 [Contarinia nasturtii]|uniref:uncharacterized protein LOC116340540 n=1 Tax=Contarinia nasturtii TaxID=265458 RepID=UPI0012D4C01D|nr:uncharacterized protein LOC116340540 [Contarinia nasturtii]
MCVQDLFGRFNKYTFLLALYPFHANMYRILIACVLVSQVQSRPFGMFFVGSSVSPIFPWLSQPLRAAGIFQTIGIHKNAYSPFSQYLSSGNTLPPRIYGRLETHFPLDVQPLYGSPPFIPSNAFNLNGQRNGFEPPKYELVPYAEMPAPLYRPQIHATPTSNTFITANGLINRFESSDYRPSAPNYNVTSQSPFQLQTADEGGQLPVVPFVTSVLPLNPYISSAGTTHLPPVTASQEDLTQKVDTTILETNPNELITQNDSTQLPTVIADGTQTIQEKTSITSEATTIESTSPLSTILQLSESTSETISTDTSESTDINSKTTTDSYSTEPSSTESSTDDELNAVKLSK